jgi:hypothetical protein
MAEFPLGTQRAKLRGGIMGNKALSGNELKRDQKNARPDSVRLYIARYRK